MCACVRVYIEERERERVIFLNIIVVPRYPIVLLNIRWPDIEAVFTMFRYPATLITTELGQFDFFQNRIGVQLQFQLWNRFTVTLTVSNLQNR